MIHNESVVRKKMKSLCLRIFNYLDNNNNVVFDKNGESLFLEYISKYFRKINDPLVVFDVGANKGDYTEKCIEKFELNKLKYNIHVFEPTSFSYNKLEGSIQLPNVTLNNFGLSDVEGKVDIFFDTEGSSLASLYCRKIDNANYEFKGKEEILLKRGSQYCAERGINHIHFLKLDVEGHELNVLRGFENMLRSHSIDFVQFEYGGANLDSKILLRDIFEFFELNNYRIYKIMKNGLVQKKYSPQWENFSYCNYIAAASEIVEE